MSDICEHDTFKDICAVCHRDNVITRMQTKRTPRKEAVWQLPNGKWKHVYNSEIEWSERSSAEVDYRFTVESDPATYDFGKRKRAA